MIRLCRINLFCGKYFLENPVTVDLVLFSGDTGSFIIIRRIYIYLCPQHFLSIVPKQ